VKTATVSCDDTLDMFIEHKAKPTHPLRLVQKDSAMASIKPHVWTFSTFATAIHALAQELPTRVTVRQLLTFAMIVEQISKGQNVTIAHIRELAGDDKTFKTNADGSFKLNDKGEREHNELLGQSIGRSYQVFLKPTKKEPDALGWFDVEANEDDRREKFLRLTPEGEAMAISIAKLLNEKPPK